MNGWLVTVDREMSGGLASIQDLYASWHPAPREACAQVASKLAHGSQIRPAPLMTIPRAVFMGLRMDPGQTMRLQGGS